MVEFLTGASGTGKTTEMFERIKNCNDSEIIALVPEQYSTEFDKKLYFHIGAQKFNDLLSQSFSGLARQLFQIYGEPDRKGEYADDMARLILIYQAINGARENPEQLKFFTKSSYQGGFAEETLKLIGDMKKAGITPQKLILKSPLFENKLSSKVSDIANIYYEYEFLMEQYGFKDNLENIREASKIAEFNGFFKGKSIFIDEFESFTADQIDMIKAMLSSAENMVITLRTDNVNAGEFTLFETVNSTYRQLSRICREMNISFKVTKLEKSYRFKSADLEYLSERVMRNLPNEPKKAPEPKNIRIFEARDMYSEAEYVCAEMRRLINSDETLKFKDIAIISNKIEEYAPVLRSAFERYGIPCFMSIEQSVSHTAVMVFFLSVLDLLTARKLKSEQIFRLLKCELLEADLNEVCLLENYCYKWGIDGDMWKEPFTAEDDNVKIAEALRKRTVEPIEKMRRKIRKKNTAEQFCKLLYGYLVKSKAEKSLGRLMNELIQNDHDSEASELKRLWGCLMDMLDSTVDTLKDNEIDFSELADIFRSMISQISYSVPPRTLDAVTAASARTARLSSPRVIFVMGASDGDFPNQVNIHGIFSDGEKQKLSKQGLEIDRSLTDLIASERLIVYKALSTASNKLYLSYPLTDLSGQAKFQARIVDQLCEMYPNGKNMIIRDSLTSDFYAVTKKSAYYHYMQDRSKNTTETASLCEALLNDEEYRHKMILALSKTGQSLKYNISSNIIEKLKNFSPLYLSPSAMERYNKCHFMYFCDDLLKLKIPERVDLDSRITGNIVHECFYHILGRRSKAEFISMSYEELNSAVLSEAEAYRQREMGGDFGKTPRFELFFNKLTERLGDVFLHTQHSLMASDFVPDAFELKIADNNCVKLKFGDNRELIFGGIVDRVDVCTVGEDKYVRVVDYKSSKKTIDEQMLAGGLNLQMLLYMFALTESGNIYGDFEPTGVLYTPLQIKKIDIDNAKIETFNDKAVGAGLKTTGLLLDKKDVLEKMEHGINGEFIPAKVNKDGTFSAYSSVISKVGMERLKEYVYGCLTGVAEQILSGDIEAIPLKIGKTIPCNYCSYAGICGNANGKICREPLPEKIKETAEILGKETKK